MKLDPVDSSNIEAIGYADEILVIKFRGGSAYRYSGVPRTIVDALLRAESKGSFFHRYIGKDVARYPVTKLTSFETARLTVNDEKESA